MLVHLWIRNHVRMVVRCMGKGCCYCEGKSIAPYDLPSSLATGFAAPAPSFGPAMPSIGPSRRSEEHTSELQSLMRISYAVFCLKKKRIQSKYKTEEHSYRNSKT